MKEEWKEGQDRVIPLPTDEPKVVNLYLQWAYRNMIFSRKRTEEQRHDSDEFSLLTDAFVFGEKIQDDHFKDAVVDAIIKSASTPGKGGHLYYPGAATIGRAYEGTPPGSPLRRLMVDFWVQYGGNEWIKTDMNREFLTDLVRELLPIRQPQSHKHPASGNESTCSYHQHDADQFCYSRAGE